MKKEEEGVKSFDDSLYWAATALLHKRQQQVDFIREALQAFSVLPDQPDNLVHYLIGSLLLYCIQIFHVFFCIWIGQQFLILNKILKHLLHFVKREALSFPQNFYWHLKNGISGDS